MGLSGKSSNAYAGCTEPYEICVLEAQRNNALNDVAHIAGEQDRQEKYWAQYLAGEETQRKELAAWWQAYFNNSPKDVILDMPKNNKDEKKNEKVR